MTIAPSQLSARESAGFPDADPASFPVELFVVPTRLEVTLWATSPMLCNLTNMDINKDGRIWVAEGVRYRKYFDRKPQGDRVVVIEDTNGDGNAH
jgi:hypothetical protein